MGWTQTEWAVRKEREFVVVALFCYFLGFFGVLFLFFALFETGLLYITTALTVLEIPL